MTAANPVICQFAPFWQSSHSVPSHCQNCFKNSLLQTIPQVISNSAFLLALPHPLLHSLYVCVCACALVWGTQYYNYMILFFFWDLNVYIIVDLVKCGVLTLASETRRYRNDGYYYHYYHYFRHAVMSSKTCTARPLTLPACQTWVRINFALAFSWMELPTVTLGLCRW